MNTVKDFYNKKIPIEDLRSNSPLIREIDSETEEDESKGENQANIVSPLAFNPFLHTGPYMDQKQPDPPPRVKFGKKEICFDVFTAENH